MTGPAFDFDAFRAAYEARDAAAWLGFYADDAEWIEYGPNLSACRRRTVGRAEIDEFLRATAWPEVLGCDEPEVDADRMRFRARLRLADGHGLVEHVMLITEDGRIRRQVDVEVTD